MAERINLNCAHCGKQYSKLKCQLARGRGKYCSRQCKYEGGKTKVEVSCHNCGKPVRKFLCELDNYRSFCDKECYDNYRRENAGENTYYMENGVHEHRTVAEREIGRKLLPNEVVHHIDEDKHNNHPDNLAVFPNQQLHAKHHQFPDLVGITPYLLKNLK